MSQELYNSLLAGHQGITNGAMRDVILPAILGKEADEMLYWIGKDVAREFPVQTNDELILLTKQLGFGNLALKKKTATSQEWQLTGPIVRERIERRKEQTSFGLETGFLAQEIEFQVNSVAEAEIIERSKDTVTILVKNDPSSEADSERTELVTFIHPSQSAPQPTESHQRRDRKRAKKSW